MQLPDRRLPAGHRDTHKPTQMHEHAFKYARKCALPRASQVLADTDRAEALNSLDQIVYLVAPHEIGHAIYSLDALREVRAAGEGRWTLAEQIVVLQVQARPDPAAARHAPHASTSSRPCPSTSHAGHQARQQNAAGGAAGGADRAAHAAPAAAGRPPGAPAGGVPALLLHALRPAALCGLGQLGHPTVHRLAQLGRKLVSGG